jgi:hypothetical protein
MQAKMMKKIIKIEPVGGYTLRLSFDDGVQGECDLSHLAGRGVFAAWRNQETFEKVKIGPHGELCWPGEIDLCPDALYLKIRKQSPETLFPALNRETIYA